MYPMAKQDREPQNVVESPLKRECREFEMENGRPVESLLSVRPEKLMESGPPVMIDGEEESGESPMVVNILPAKGESGVMTRRSWRSENVRRETRRRLCDGLWRIRRPNGAREVGVALEARLLRGEREGALGGVSREATLQTILLLLPTLTVRERRVAPARRRRRRRSGVLPGARVLETARRAKREVLGVEEIRRKESPKERGVRREEVMMTGAWVHQLQTVPLVQEHPAHSSKPSPSR
jgi:hypothetical protein